MSERHGFQERDWCVDLHELSRHLWAVLPHGHELDVCKTDLRGVNDDTFVGGDERIFKRTGYWAINHW